MSQRKIWISVLVVVHWEVLNLFVFSKSDSFSSSLFFPLYFYSGKLGNVLCKYFNELWFHLYSLQFKHTQEVHSVCVRYMWCALCRVVMRPDPGSDERSFAHALHSRPEPVRWGIPQRSSPRPLRNLSCPVELDYISRNSISNTNHKCVSLSERWIIDTVCELQSLVRAHEF